MINLSKIISGLTVITISVLSVVSCSFSGKDTTENEQSSLTGNVSTTTFYTDKQLKKELDSLIDMIGEIGASPFFTKLISKEIPLENGDMLKRPDYLMPLNKASMATTLDKKYRAAVIFKADMTLAAMYHEPLTDYKQTIARLLVDINNPGLNINLNESHRRSVKSVKNMINELFDEAYKQRSVNLFWEAAVSAAIEELFLLSNNISKAPLFLNDSQVNDIFRRISLISKGINISMERHPELAETKELIKNITGLNSKTVEQLQEKLTERKESLAAIRNSLI